MRAMLAAAILGTFFLAAYLPDLGHGFIRDDFGWVRFSRATVLIDDPRERFNLESVLGPALPDALVLTHGDAWTGEIVSAGAPLPSNMTRGFRLIRGDLVPEESK